MPRERIHEGGGGKRVCLKRLSGCRSNRLSQPAAAVLVNSYLYMAFKVKEEVEPSHNKCGGLIMVLWSICWPINKRGNQTQEVNASLLQVAAKPADKNVCVYTLWESAKQSKKQHTGLLKIIWNTLSTWIHVILLRFSPPSLSFTHRAHTHSSLLCSQNRI